MGFSNNGEKRNYAKIELKKDKEVQPRFVVYQGKENPPLEFTQYEGYLKNVKFDNYPWEGEEVKQVVFVCVDPDGDETWIKTTYTGVMRSMVNAFAGKKLGLLSIRLYSTTKDGKDRANVYIESDGEKLSWKYQIDELPEMKEIKIPGKKSIWDTSELDARIDKMIEEEILPFIQSAPKPVPQEAPQEEDSMLDQVRKERSERVKSEPEEDNGVDDDLPF